MNRRWIAASAVLLSACGAMGCWSAPAAPPPAPLPAPAPVPAPEPPAPPAPATLTTVRVCLVREARMERVEAEVDPATGDTTVAGRTFLQAYPVTSEYASQARWYWDNVPITFDGRRYIKLGLPRVLEPSEVEPIGSYAGIAVFAEPRRQLGPADRLYVPVSPGCTFQAYEIGERGSAVRG
jgi:ABC-type phosphate transport system substrate-binding protein